MSLISENESYMPCGDFLFDTKLNITECVIVPSSEHVAEIVGKQGCKIKALRNKTGTYIKTPERGQQPVFIITGRKEDVYLAKSDILQCADNFNMLRASRLCGVVDGYVDNENIATLFSNNQDYITYHLSVPNQVVGLIVGPKGATIKRIQQDTKTYIVTPGRDCTPVFYITGSLPNIIQACNEIYNYINIRIGKISNEVCSSNYTDTNIDTNYSLLNSYENILGFDQHFTINHSVGSSSDISSLSPIEFSDIKSNLCLICKRGEGVYVMEPCMHGQYCTNCSSSIMARLKDVVCPEPSCRKPVVRISSFRSI